ncbi:DUF4350 domain-containing protein [Stutzerimonas zhaodongensis]|uniref:DUF4350 domain-containing protein n=1 Tax=Stutzerimonas zhaodongensis TaxID=1176257 RepID=UPI001F4DAF15|nr:DUF4350 domain-containing protein [Stutzerimonas zhaodongensis]UNG19798.1 DUF4350 domain-containing protein [Stutzerimonas zhaodongensis]
MTRPRRLLLLVAGALLLGLMLFFAISRATPYEETIEHGPAPEVRSNPYLAAERFLTDQGRAVDHAQGLGGLTETKDSRQVLLLLGERSTMTPAQAERLLHWVGKGGHLVFVAERIWDENAGNSGDLLLDALNLQQHEVSEKPDDSHVADGAANAEKRPVLTRLYLENENAPAYLAFDTNYHLYDAGGSAHAWANSASATHMLQLRHGSGLITALTDSWIWQNDAIAQYDHAWLLWYLTQDRDVTLIYRTDHDGLLQRLLLYFPEALSAALLLLLLGCWHAAQRQGPLLEPADRGRRQLREHLRGSADFLYRRAGQRHLIATLQNDIIRQAQHRHPNLVALDHADRCKVLAQLSRTPIEAVTHAMRSSLDKKMSNADFTRQVARLQSLRNAL